MNTVDSVPREKQHPTRGELIAVFKDYLAVGLGKDELEERESLVRAYLRGAGVSRAVDLKPEQRAGAIAFIKKQVRNSETEPFIDPRREKRAAEIPAYGNPFRETSYESSLKALAQAGEKIAAQMGCPRYIVDPEGAEPATPCESEAPASSPAGYDPHTLSDHALQEAIERTVRVIREGSALGLGDEDTVTMLLEDHLTDLLEIQRRRAGGDREAI